MLLLQRFHIARSLRMIASAHNQFGIRQRSLHELERLDHQLKPLVGSPFSERQDAVFGVSAP
jgi:hypothetical protein